LLFLTPTISVGFMKISKKSQYGLRAMICLNQSGLGYLSLREISEKEGISFDYLEKICSKLEKSGLLKSKKGIRGGYALSRSPKKINVGEILRALENKMALVECIGNKGRCARKRSCKSISVWKKLQNSIEETIDSITLYDLMK